MYQLETRFARIIYTPEYIIYFLFLAPYARTTRYEEAFLPKGKKRPHFIRAKRVSNCYMREKKLTVCVCVYVRQIAKTRYTFACLHT